MNFLLQRWMQQKSIVKQRILCYVWGPGNFYVCLCFFFRKLEWNFTPWFVALKRLNGRKERNWITYLSSEGFGSSISLYIDILFNCSLQITPACNLPLKSLRNGGKMIIVNLQVHHFIFNRFFKMEILSKFCAPIGSPKWKK